MNDKKASSKNSNDPKPSKLSLSKDVVNNNEEFVIPFEAACSPEFQNGCFVMEDEAESEFQEK